eukprot:458100-Prorocentrum_minimum.AAC.1
MPREDCAKEPASHLPVDISRRLSSARARAPPRAGSPSTTARTRSSARSDIDTATCKWGIFTSGGDQFTSREGQFTCSSARSAIDTATCATPGSPIGPQVEYYPCGQSDWAAGGNLTHAGSPIGPQVGILPMRAVRLGR